VIDNVVFDIGWVLVRFDYQPLIDLLAAHGAPQRDRNSVMDGIGLEDHETGRLSGAGLLQRLAGLATQPPSLAQLEAQWVGMFELEKHMYQLARDLSERHRVYLLSNIGDLHWAHLSSTFRLHEIGHGALLSYEAGVMKPHERIYSEAERRFGLDPAKTVFIDDRADNIDSARSRGWHGIVHQHRAPERTLGALRALGVQC
jgi:HAD superfamily hydrolase (TIGR01509 family)